MFVDLLTTDQIAIWISTTTVNHYQQPHEDFVSIGKQLDMISLVAQFLLEKALWNLKTNSAFASIEQKEPQLAHIIKMNQVDLATNAIVCLNVMQSSNQQSVHSPRQSFAFERFLLHEAYRCYFQSKSYHYALFCLRLVMPFCFVWFIWFGLIWFGLLLC